MPNFLKHAFSSRKQFQTSEGCPKIAHQDNKQGNSPLSIFGSAFFLLSFPEELKSYWSQTSPVFCHRCQHTVWEIILIHCKTQKTTDAFLFDREDLFLAPKVEVSFLTIEPGNSRLMSDFQQISIFF